ncbi:fumarylacetoacetate hydrolase family protein [Saccharopolyspora griseoalba]|uniref:Fumarylacetoacetate hydrolase family protein n=1 Tax=Saccharopolyspora griseoalba TaxID=1431848 RepID=A0ABW2LUA1_9PSEU
MRFANVRGRLSLMTEGGGVVDLAEASGGRIGADVRAAYRDWEAVLEIARGLDVGGSSAVEDPSVLENPVPEPRQVFAIGLNYADHAAESAFAVPAEPAVFTKYVTSLTGPRGEIALPPGRVDWEVELVVVIGRRAHRVPAEKAWEHVAGLSVGQDLSERDLQLVGPVPQFSLAKSHPGFGPIGPVLVTPDEFADPEDLELGCLVNGEQLQKGKTSDMVFPVPELIARLSRVAPLLPGDVIFTGTPSGVGLGRSPERFLAAGDELVSYVRGVGEMRHRMIAGR